MLPRFAIAFTLGAMLVISAEAVPGLRLPSDVRPVRQSAELTIVPGSDTFAGRIEFELDIRSQRDVIWLNALELKISSAAVNGEAAATVPGSRSVVGIKPARPLQPGPARLRIDYEGRISRTSSAGIFQLKDGENWYVYTQFESTDARRAFPCFDEPSFKSPWQITLRVPDGMLAVANTPETSSSAAVSGMKEVRFAPTRPLPSYLVAFAVGPFETIDAGHTAHGKAPLRVIVPKGHSPEAVFVRHAIPELLGLLEDYFGRPYPYEKLDSIVMPISNFAMENVGLITYGQSLLLAKSGDDTRGRQRTCATVVAHEMAHQWFGDLVTTAWWDDIWLNEAFATWMENKIVERWKPDWGIDVDRVQSRLYAMDTDSLVSARRIRQPIESESDIANAFDAITYQKGAAVIHMFEQWIGPDRFRRGVQVYLNRHSDSTATANDFLADLSAGSGRDVRAPFSTFLDQPGVPVVSAELKCGAGKPALDLSQKRSLPIGSEGSQDQRWDIPVCASYAASRSPACTLLTAPGGTLGLPGKACPGWVLPNAGENGYYRVSYRGALLASLIENARRLTTPEKVGVLGDVRALVRTGDISAAEALKLAPAFAGDANADVVSGVLAIIGVLPGDEIPSSVEPQRAALVRSLFGARARKLGWSAKPGESSDERLREQLVPAVARTGEDPELIGEAGKLAREWLETGKGVDPNMLGAVLNTAAEFGDRSLFDSLLASARKAEDPRRRETLIGALGSFRKPELAEAALNLLLAKTFDVRESLGLLYGPMQYRETSQLPFQFVRSHLDELLEVFPHEIGNESGGMLVTVAYAFCSQEGAREAQQLFANRVSGWVGAERNFRIALENIRLCAARKEKILPSYEEGLRAITGGAN